MNAAHRGPWCLPLSTQSCSNNDTKRIDICMIHCFGCEFMMEFCGNLRRISKKKEEIECRFPKMYVIKLSFAGIYDDTITLSTAREMRMQN